MRPLVAGAGGGQDGARGWGGLATNKRTYSVQTVWNGVEQPLEGHVHRHLLAPLRPVVHGQVAPGVEAEVVQAHHLRGQHHLRCRQRRWESRWVSTSMRVGAAAAMGGTHQCGNDVHDCKNGYGDRLVAVGQRPHLVQRAANRELCPHLHGARETIHACQRCSIGAAPPGSLTRCRVSAITAIARTQQMASNTAMTRSLLLLYMSMRMG